MKLAVSSICALLLVLAPCDSSAGIRPVILVHGVGLTQYSNVEVLKGTIAKEHPSANITVVKAFGDETSLFTPLWEQVQGTYLEIKSVLESAPRGVILICYSQGGLVCRGILQTIPNHNVHTFITLSSPHMGQYGIPKFIQKKIDAIPHSVPLLKHTAYLIFYHKIAQKHISIANFWNDPYHQDLYRKECIFLPSLNDNNRSEFRENFLKIKQLVVIGGKSDDIIAPWQSSIFGYYAENSDSIINMTSQKMVYQENSFGLRSLDENNRLSVCTVHNVTHTNWPKDPVVYAKCIKQWLV